MNENRQNSIRHQFFRFTTTRPVAISMIVIGILIFGMLSYNFLSLNLMPDITYPSLTVRTEYPGAAPEEVETAISRPIEEALGVVTNLVAITSISKSGQSDVILEFDWDTDMNEAISEVREKLDLVFLPDDAEKPIILKYDPSLDPVMRLGLSGGPDLFYVRYLAEEQIKRALETVEGVAAVKVKGGYEEEIRVELDEQKITLMGLNIQQIRQRLAQENVNLAGGELKEGQTEYIVRTLNEFKTVEEIADIVLNNTSGRLVRIRDIGRVYRTHKERQIITRLNGRESVELEIYKEGDANIVEVARNVRNKIFGTPEQQAFVARLKQREQQKPSPDRQKRERPSPQDRRRAFQEQMKMREMTDFLAYQLPPDVHLEILTDQSIFIRNSIDEVKSTALYGGLFAVIVLFLFLNNLPNTLIVGLAIPISVIATFAPMRLFDVSLNIMSLGGLALGIGMLVDNSIVVIESIFRCREEGDGFIESVIRGTGEVGPAVSASTLTTIAVFFPMVFVKGVAGQIFGDLAITVVFSLLASLGVALFLIPMLASRKFQVRGVQSVQDSPKRFFLGFESFRNLGSGLRSYFSGFSGSGGAARIGRGVLLPFFLLWVITRFLLQFLFECGVRLYALLILLFGALVLGIRFLWTRLLSPALSLVVRIFNRGFRFVNDAYPRVIDWALTNKVAVLSLALIPFLITLLVLLPRLGQELIPEVHQGEFNVELTLPIGTPVETTAEVIQPIEAMILEEPLVEKISTVAGVDLTKVSDTESGEHTAKITVTLKPTDDPAEAEEEVLASIRKKLGNFSGIAYKISRPVLFSFKTPIEVEIKGYNLQELATVTRQAVQVLSEIPGLTDVKTNLQRGNPEIQIIYDRTRLARYGLNVLDVANLVRNKVRGDVATEFKKEDRRIDVLVKVREQDRATLMRLRRLNVNPNGSIPVPLESVARIEIHEGPSEIRRIDQERAAVILANIVGRSLSDVSADVYRALQSLDMPPDFTFEITGQNKEMEVSLSSLRLALLLAIFLVYIVMASQFESFVHPFVILFTVPFALIGVVLVLWVLGISLNIMVFLGLIMLAGIVVNNAIVLVDYINQLRRKGLAKEEAIKQAGQARLRPILMTTLTTVLGLLPMAIGLGEGAELRIPMAITVIAGLISSTLLTLVVIPTVYSIFERGEKMEEAVAG
ncbi:MAG: efflux RND transporter permease subunit [Calditrichaeota bacterium]|nr:MAG: efflux RND transporter permease subunit [Calditrichota bacterium]